MQYDLSSVPSPLIDLDHSFENYLKKRKDHLSKHMLGNGLPDYAYKMDMEYRKKLDAVPGLYDTAQKLCSTLVAQKLQEANMNYLSVGPEQFPEIYEIACSCAKKLGIGIPNIYISPMTSVTVNSSGTGGFSAMNAYTYGCDDVEPFIVITEFALERLTLGELQALIGHECGHIHNYHSTYNVLTNMIVNLGLTGTSMISQVLAQLLSSGVELTMKMWSRAAEVSADRAGLICTDNIEDAINLNKKMLYGGVKVDDKITTEMSIESLQKQLSVSYESAMRYTEVYATHPITIKRILADMEFAECETFYHWRPDLRKPGQTLRTKEETDMRCKKFIDVTSKEAGTIVGKRRSKPDTQA